MAHPTVPSNPTLAALIRIERKVNLILTTVTGIEVSAAEQADREDIAMAQREDILAKVGRLETAIQGIAEDEAALLEIVNRPAVQSVLTPEDMDRLETITARAEAVAALVPPAGGAGTGGGTGGGGGTEPDA